ncbi:hypothetical protein HETIRDRAFT_460841 [Heterobasidion irregulare TC 32-1]|uniref:Uncharacterized protein n=1 Tax=Heterobasidion irregulare (strain TC 32-1) TaxID=747525 RepID=W4JUN3_HETIT|nr:uncharacterized protein HETIRDRAFT_460841 [Heterobasidion irregulare TC 32-1]ETW76601.1 hypothetical protein HETIRDRAFT_460841 [Heterobasidion irregulare TC 32-1]
MATANDDRIILERMRIERDLHILLAHAANSHQFESASYAFHNLSLSSYCPGWKPLLPTISFSCHPQPYFSHFIGEQDSQRLHSRRIPDFAAIIAELSLPPSLVFWTEVKPILGHRWNSAFGLGDTTDTLETIMTAADTAFMGAIIQVNEQALFSFQRFDGDVHYAFVMVAGFFSLLKYTRPIGSVPNVQPAPTTIPQKRARADSTLKARALEDIGDPISIVPDVLYFNVPMFMVGQGLNPMYLRALSVVADSSAKLRSHFEEPSLFRVPPNAPEPSEQSLVRGRDMVWGALNFERRRLSPSASTPTGSPDASSAAGSSFTQSEGRPRKTARTALFSPIQTRSRTRSEYLAETARAKQLAVQKAKEVLQALEEENEEAQRDAYHKERAEKSVSKDAPMSPLTSPPSSPPLLSTPRGGVFQNTIMQSVDALLALNDLLAEQQTPSTPSRRGARDEDVSMPAAGPSRQPIFATPPARTGADRDEPRAVLGSLIETLPQVELPQNSPAPSGKGKGKARPK